MTPFEGTVLSVSVVGGALALDHRAHVRLLVSQPICGGLLTGLVLGDWRAGFLAGSILQMMFLGTFPVRGAPLPDLPLGGVIASAPGRAGALVGGVRGPFLDDRPAFRVRIRRRRRGDGGARAARGGGGARGRGGLERTASVARRASSLHRGGHAARGEPRAGEDLLVCRGIRLRGSRDFFQGLTRGAPRRGRR